METKDYSLEEALGEAIRMEEEGKEFYLEFSKNVRGNWLKEMFKELALEEENHIKTVKKVYEKIKNEGKLEDWIVNTQNRPPVFGSIFDEAVIKDVKVLEDEISATSMAMGIEEKSIEHYEKLAKAFETDPKLKRFFLTLSYEERGHYLRIFDALEYLKDPGSFLLLKERSMRNGG
ncbi:MAG: ferritin family protein [Desulfobacterota bacterium]|nr:ferritin family protein [Thermodesulfobacteriota bacterium]MDW8002312.1 ferritin family protein [Deltaproteobacteria bacterium]